jgi:quercetin dioxygenase-like cupin family protein
VCSVFGERRFRRRRLRSETAAREHGALRAWACTAVIERIAKRQFMSPRTPVTFSFGRQDRLVGKEGTTMTHSEQPELNRRRVMLAALGAGAAATMATAAQAAECPPDRQVVNSNVNGPTEGKGVADAVLTSIELGGEKVGLRGYQLRLRRLVVQPGGEVPVHSHENRPALIYIAEGEMTEFKNICAVPIVHRAGEATPEDHRVVHWWRNTGRVPAVILSADLFQAGENPHMM